MRYNNYHKHDHAGNPWIADSIAKPEDYCKRAAELGHTTAFTVNHGFQGNIFEWLEMSKKYGLKMCYGTEAYFVHNRGQPDRSNKHIVIIARNNFGVLQLNDIMSEAHLSGFYYRARIDDELLFSLNPNDFIVTSACVAGIWDDRELLLSLKNHFKENFFLEIQSHNMELQKKVNSEMYMFGIEAGIPLIHANDSHYIYPEDSKYRDIFLKGKDHDYGSEKEMILDYPDSDTIYNRYEKQGVLSRKTVQEALESTLVFDDCEEITLINDDIKLPPVSENPNKDFKEIINREWKTERDDIPKEYHKKYLEAIRSETDIVERTRMENYFLIDYKVAKDGQEKYGGRLTNTGRGSAPSFFVTKLLRLTDIDRLSAPITLFPSRFMSVERILGARSLPDIDLNTTDRKPFIKATEDLLGKENCAWMLSWHPMQDAKAFRVYCKGIGMNISEYDEVAKDLERYREDKKWKDIIEESKRFVGVIESVSESPCSMLLYDKPVRKELGLIRTSKGEICCLLDGYNCDKYKYLKNDYLTVTIWAIIRDVCELAGIKIPTIKEFDKLLDDKTFKIYEDGLTCTINQADSDFATELVKRYKPRSVAEMSAFVAIIRPGCASLLQDFIDRKPYTTGVPELDDILKEGNHRMIYQELIMKYLIWLGVKETESYDIIKKIAKKKFKKDELEKLKEKLFAGWKTVVGREEGFDETWAVVEQAARYSFNASHSLSYAYDSLYGAYLKSHYPLEYYTVVFNYYSDDTERTSRLTHELQFFNITLKPIKFRYSQAYYSEVKSKNSIYKGIASIKNMSEKISEEIYALRDNYYETFIDLLYDLHEKTSIDKTQINVLIGLNFFTEYGDPNFLRVLYDRFCALRKRKQLKKSELPDLCANEQDARAVSGKESAKTFTSVNIRAFLKRIANKQPYKPQTLKERIAHQIEYLGYLDIKDDKYKNMAVVMSVNTRYSPRLKAYSLKNGTIFDCKVSKKVFNACKLEYKDIILIQGYRMKPLSRKTDDGKWEVIEGTNELWLTKFHKVDNI